MAVVFLFLLFFNLYGKISEKVEEFVTWFYSLINFYVSNFIIDVGLSL